VTSARTSLSEALAVTKADIDFGTRRLSVSRRLADGELHAPKTRYGVRRVPSSPGLARQLWARLATADDGTLVFATSTGRALDRAKLYAAAAVSDATQPRDRARTVGVYRCWRDFRLVAGALIAGFAADATSPKTAISTGRGSRLPA
jgi:integrase